MSEVKVIKPIWHLGKPVEVDSVIDLPESDTAYLVGIGRVERIVAEVPAPVDLGSIPVVLKHRKAKE